MLYVYTGKLVYTPYAVDTIITFIVPEGTNEYHTCLVYWQWGVNGSGAKNVNIKFTGQFQKNATANNVEIRAYDVDYYWFKWDLVKNEVQMMDKTNAKCGPPFPLKMVFPNPIAFE
ncbi:hypothetical protein Q9L58_005620 [Maublancomyces gigas]|uniref:Uncharacterized protein n=1 Tax=Discina gigas TaxID=1032678 RepID=A0ABR3GI17_9PEZI